MFNMIVLIFLNEQSIFSEAVEMDINYLWFPAESEVHSEHFRKVFKFFD